MVGSTMNFGISRHNSAWRETPIRDVMNHETTATAVSQDNRTAPEPLRFEGFSATCAVRIA